MTLTETMIVFRSDQISSTPFAFEMKLLFIGIFIFIFDETFLNQIKSICIFKNLKGSEEACQSKAIDDSIILSTEEICYRPLLQIVKGRSRQTARKCFARRHISPRIENDIADEFEDGYVSDE
jgi:hypothetical protein